ncbi:unnamed protein product [Leuciscus chuanchicus]
MTGSRLRRWAEPRCQLHISWVCFPTTTSVEYDITLTFPVVELIRSPPTTSPSEEDTNNSDSPEPVYLPVPDRKPHLPSRESPRTKGKSSAKDPATIMRGGYHAMMTFNPRGRNLTADLRGEPHDPPDIATPSNPSERESLRAVERRVGDRRGSVIDTSNPSRSSRTHTHKRTQGATVLSHSAS